MYKNLFVAVIFCLCLNSPLLHAQDVCKVEVNDISGTYTGECKSGKANGQGKSVGTDTYEGNFKNGYPDGSGTYTWKDGSSYTGNFKKGQKDGQGKMFYKTKGEDSVQIGFWKKGTYVGMYEKPYVIESKTARFEKLEIRMNKGLSRNITFNCEQKQVQSISRGVIPVATISSITVLDGQYSDKNVQVMPRSSVSRVVQVQYPFRAIFYFSSGENVQILFNEPAAYDIDVLFQL